MVYRALADAVVLLHFAFILFVAVGALLTWRWPRMVWAHLPALAWGVGTVTIGFPCPLTNLEKALDRLAGSDVYDGGFIDQYVENVVYPGEYSSALRFFAAVLIVIGYVGFRRRRAQGTHEKAAGPNVAAQNGGAARRLEAESGRAGGMVRASR